MQLCLVLRFIISTIIVYIVVNVPGDVHLPAYFMVFM